MLNLAWLAGMQDSQANIQGMRDGKYNLIIATAVAAEGLDITSCCLIIRYTLPPRALEHTQSRGRARAPNSKLLLMLAKGNIEHRELIATNRLCTCMCLPGSPLEEGP